MFEDIETKNRPKVLDEFVFANAEFEQQIRAYCKGTNTRSLILYGKHGTGKSLLAELIPLEIEGFKAEVNIVHGYDFTSKKDALKAFTKNKQFDRLFAVNGQRFNYVVLDEFNFDSASSIAFRSILDKNRGIDIAIIPTNRLDLIDDGVKSRCELIEVPAVPAELFLQRAKNILAAEHAHVDDRALLDVLDCTYRLNADNRSYYKKLDQLLSMARSSV